MNDREQLELAAKAAGYWNKQFNCYEGPMDWEPLTDDGDALRLAVKQNMTLAVGVARSDAGEFTEFDLWETDKYAATRRAIVRAAAEIGRQMQEGGAA